MTHSPEPWEVIDYKGRDRRWERKGRYVVASGCFRNQEDAARIVACVNALSGIPTSVLEDHITIKITKDDKLIYGHILNPPTQQPSSEPTPPPTTPNPPSAPS